MVPLIAFIGGAIDYTRANAARSAMQAALDSTALMLSKDLTAGTIAAADISAKAQTYFNALYTNKDAKGISVSAVYTPNSATGSSIQLTGSGSITTDFMRVAGFPTLGFNVGSTTAWGNVRMRVAMALDNTGSMADDGKMPAMQKASKDFIDQLSKLAKTDGDVYVSIIPFAKDVNVGSSNYSQSWVDFSLWDAQPQNDTKGTCAKGSASSEKSCVTYGKSNWTPDHSQWNGCVTDRDQDYDTKNTAPTPGNSSTLFPADEWSACPVSLMPLSYDWSALKKLIDGMKPNGNTNQSIGMAWAWMSLTQSQPLNAPAKDANYTYKEFYHPAFRWIEHAEPVVLQRLADRCASEGAVRQRKSSGHYDLYNPGQYEQACRPYVCGPAILRQWLGQFLHGNLRKPDSIGVHFHRHLAC